MSDLNETRAIEHRVLASWLIVRGTLARRGQPLSRMAGRLSGRPAFPRARHTRYQHGFGVSFPDSYANPPRATLETIAEAIRRPLNLSCDGTWSLYRRRAPGRPDWRTVRRRGRADVDNAGATAETPPE